MVHHEYIVTLSRVKTLSQGFIVFISLKAFIGYPDARILLHEIRQDFLYNRHVFRLIFISEKSDCGNILIGNLEINNLIPSAAAPQHKGACQKHCVQPHHPSTHTISSL